MLWNVLKVYDDHSCIKDNQDHEAFLMFIGTARRQCQILAVLINC